MKYTKKKWTKDEELVVFNLVKENSDCLKRAFQLAAKKLNRTERSVVGHWYSSMRDNSEYCFLMIGDKVLKNTKISRVDSPKGDKVKVSIWKKIIKLLFN